jgi:hypothetical protein
VHGIAFVISPFDSVKLPPFQTKREKSSRKQDIIQDWDVDVLEIDSQQVSMDNSEEKRQIHKPMEITPIRRNFPSQKHRSKTNVKQNQATLPPYRRKM